MNETITRFYAIYRLNEDQISEISGISNQELDEIQQIQQAINDVVVEPPKFITTT